jgi:hypothetical protein
MSVGIRREKNASNPRPSAIMRMQNARCEMARKTGLRRAESMHESTQKAQGTPYSGLQRNARKNISMQSSMHHGR